MKIQANVTVKCTQDEVEEIVGQPVKDWGNGYAVVADPVPEAAKDVASPKECKAKAKAKAKVITDG